MIKNIIIKGLAKVTYRATKEIPIDIPYSLSEEDLKEYEIYNKEQLSDLITEYINYDYYPEDDGIIEDNEELESIEILNLQEILKELEDIIPVEIEETCCDSYLKTAYNFCPECGKLLK